MSSKDRSVPNKLVQIALVMLGVTLIVASFVAFALTRYNNKGMTARRSVG